MKKLLSVLLSVIMVISALPLVVTAAEQDVVILYTNDVHCAIDDYAVLAAYRADLIADGHTVITVDAGDAIQGEVIGSFTEGEAVVDIMNTVGYDYAVPGNHEFDYSFRTMEELASQLKATVVSCNLINKKTDKTLFKPYIIKEYGPTKVAYVGVITPETLTSSPKLFDDIDYIFQFDAENNVVTYEFEGDFCADSL